MHVINQVRLSFIAKTFVFEYSEFGEDAELVSLLDVCLIFYLY